jgi:AraC family transcriptional regulator, exoenzyme S synthesis regulatory protein ExsA
VINFYDRTFNNPGKPRQLSFGKSLVAEFNCPLDKKLQDAWSHHNYIVYVLEGHKTWHTPHGSYDLKKGSCVFVRKGACFVEQFFDSVFCLVFVFLPDEFISDVLRSRCQPLSSVKEQYDPVIPVDKDERLDAFFHSMSYYFDSAARPDPALIELKFRELVMTLEDNPHNAKLRSYFFSLMNSPKSISLREVMEGNFCFNLKLDEFARLSSRSLSAFKRDFQKEFDSTPGKWLLERRLQHAMHLLSNNARTVSEAAFETGFENPSHFSRAFRGRFGFAPAFVKLQVAV